MKCNEIFDTYETEPCEHNEQVKIKFQNVQTVYIINNWRELISFINTSNYMHVCILLRKVQFYITLLVNRLIVTYRTFPEVT